MSSIISAIGISTPPYQFAQNRILEFMKEAHKLDVINSRRLEKLYQVSGIAYRHSVIEDFGKNRGNYTFFGNNDRLEPFPTTSLRSTCYEQAALPLSLEAIENCLKPINFDPIAITHLITVSCTGMYAPGLDIELVESLHLNPAVERTCINFMGCYGAFNALKVADYICRAQHHAKVLIVDVELCTIHFQRENTLDNWLANSLFADGAAAVLIQHEGTTDHKLYHIKSFYTEVITGAKKEMAWRIGNFGYQMQLSNKIADHIKDGIKGVTDRLLKKANIALEDIGQFAIHPGGRKILEVCDEAFSLNSEQNAHAYQVLHDYGNMSSVTILFVLDALGKKLKTKRRAEQILSFAFGPGLTVESMLLAYA
ncbi:chalcone and stilbene synthase domain protein [Pseudopedobacter saltans DSM 12145]|uniref:Chalcone and stilbene synthase domain protein n=1 Tax=Pseudopedobacter saltans (strain ATCC 51119 / DSM 12145 / JCM 21818 / CCUG 39354 / LMG 10337 / NBRC 100064 / NCIMB 13643) TaxID=762903 RepID=F0S867_PSESL|nr:type III polyketide synthase [Pseudopedobacter saltans]ADY52329.1 chalcone and stilbene synthase domain protein [Pseudopedobacter saltans DSM 12145]